VQQDKLVQCPRLISPSKSEDKSRPTEKLYGRFRFLTHRGSPMNTKFALFLLSVCISAGCNPAFGQNLYPVQGPLAALAPPPAFVAKFTGANSGKFTMAHSGGESFKGTWVMATPSFVNSKPLGTSASYPPQPNLAFAWDAVYGQGYFLAKVLGKRMKQANAIGDHGTVIQVEFVFDTIMTDGVAVDNEGNIYKVVL